MTMCNDKGENGMNKNLLIVGAGIYGMVAKEIAESMGCFEKIAFIDDNAKALSNGIEVIGKVSDIGCLASDYYNVVIAIGNPEVRLKLMRSIDENISCQIISLISPRAYVSPSAQIEKGCIIEPMAVIQSHCKLEMGCIVSAGAVVNHTSTCCAGVHLDCNATVEGDCVVPAGTKVCSGEVYKRNGKMNVEELRF